MSDKLKEDFGFVEGETRCQRCRKKLGTNEAVWAFGTWWCNQVIGCKQKNPNN